MILLGFSNGGRSCRPPAAVGHIYGHTKFGGCCHYGRKMLVIGIRIKTHDSSSPILRHRNNQGKRLNFHTSDMVRSKQFQLSREFRVVHIISWPPPAHRGGIFQIRIQELACLKTSLFFFTCWEVQRLQQGVIPLPSLFVKGLEDITVVSPVV